MLADSGATSGVLAVDQASAVNTGTLPKRQSALIAPLMKTLEQVEKAWCIQVVLTHS